MRDSMRVPDQVGVRWHIGVQPAEPSLYWILIFAFCLQFYIALLFLRPLIRLGFFFFLWPEKVMLQMTTQNLGSAREIL